MAADNTIPDGRSDGGVYGFPRSQARRVAEAVQRVEAQYRNGPPRRRASGSAAASFPPIFADSGAGFAVGSRASPSTATVTKLALNGAGPGMTTTGGSTVTCYSTFTTAIPASKTIAMIWTFGNYYVVQVMECS